MQYRKFGKYDIKVSALGYGCMRLPVLKDGSINEEEAVKQIRHAIDNGVNYIDTAYVYHGGKSEVLLSKAFADGYRDKVFVADKMPMWSIKTYGDFDRILNEQLDRLKTDHIDFYLLHSLSKNTWEKGRDLGALKFLDEAQKDGRIRHRGFSFHDKFDVFKEIVDAYNWDFCQMQYNYMDEHNQAGVDGLRYASQKGMAVVIMEPLLGGKLARKPPVQVQNVWDSAKVKRTPAEWGLRWLWNQKEVTVVLSGMNAIQQIDENIKIASETAVNSLSEEEKNLIYKARDKYKELTKVDCTGCRYCVPCPFGVDIPRIFHLYNQGSIYNDIEGSSRDYMHMDAKNRASVCRECGRCERLCPQHIEIRKKLKEAHRVLSV